MAWMVRKHLNNTVEFDKNSLYDDGCHKIKQQKLNPVTKTNNDFKYETHGFLKL